MKKEIIFIGMIFLLSVSLVGAISYPHAFYGKIVVQDGKSAEGLTLVGKVGGIATGSTEIINESYNIVVTNPLGGNEKVEFYIGDEKAKEEPIFETFGISHLNLTFNTISENQIECGNNICEEGECSLCPIDCKISECRGNGICEPEMDEDCITAPEDCGSCPSSGGGGSGGGGGGGSSGSSSNNYKTDSSKENTITEKNKESPQEDFGIKTIETLNKEEQENKKLTGITGAVVGFLGSGKGISLIVGLIIFLSGLGVILSQKKVASKNEKKNS